MREVVLLAPQESVSRGGGLGSCWETSHHRVRVTFSTSTMKNNAFHALNISRGGGTNDSLQLARLRKTNCRVRGNGAHIERSQDAPEEEVPTTWNRTQDINAARRSFCQTDRAIQSNAAEVNKDESQVSHRQPDQLQNFASR